MSKRKKNGPNGNSAKGCPTQDAEHEFGEGIEVGRTVSQQTKAPEVDYNYTASPIEIAQNAIGLYEEIYMHCGTAHAGITYLVQEAIPGLQGASEVDQQKRWAKIDIARSKFFDQLGLNEILVGQRARSNVSLDQQREDAITMLEACKDVPFLAGIAGSYKNKLLKLAEVGHPITF